MYPATFPKELIFVNRLEAFNYFYKTLNQIQQMLKEIPEKMKDVESLFVSFLNILNQIFLNKENKFI